MAICRRLLSPEEQSAVPDCRNDHPRELGWGYREQLQKKEWSHHDIGDPNQGSPSHHMYRVVWEQAVLPGKDSAGDKLTPNYCGTPSHPIGHASNYAGQGQHPVPNQLTLVGTVRDGLH
ncbi:Hypothetical predicted protein [Mytilus galloprovincialis]|uniref:Uncharacterized protein n=1 Tax=Mytilus galloprovincialis TaxID=29158 RepID=A0A8B6DXI5_MYTGA|nr:Hypothetical predicted protein [Mytilus galloprovincialis]